MTWQFDGNEPRAWRPKKMLTPMQAQTLVAIQRLTHERSIPPTFRELAKEVNVSDSRARLVVGRLEQMGLVIHDNGYGRTVRLCDGWIPSGGTTPEVIETSPTLEHLRHYVVNSQLADHARCTTCLLVARWRIGQIHSQPDTVVESEP